VRRPYSAAPGPLEGYPVRFGLLLHSLAERRGSASSWPGCSRGRRAIRDQALNLASVGASVS